MIGGVHAWLARRLGGDLDEVRRLLGDHDALVARFGPEAAAEIERHAELFSAPERLSAFPTPGGMLREFLTMGLNMLLRGAGALLIVYELALTIELHLWVLVLGISLVALSYRARIADAFRSFGELFQR